MTRMRGAPEAIGGERGLIMRNSTRGALAGRSARSIVLSFMETHPSRRGSIEAALLPECAKGEKLGGCWCALPTKLASLRGRVRFWPLADVAFCTAYVCL